MRSFRVIEDAYLPSINLEAGGVEDELVARAGDVVYEFHGATYGCISPGGIAVTREPGVNPFFEIAKSNLASNEEE